MTSPYSAFYGAYGYRKSARFDSHALCRLCRNLCPDADMCEECAVEEHREYRNSVKKSESQFKLRASKGPSPSATASAGTATSDPRSPSSDLVISEDTAEFDLPEAGAKALYRGFGAVAGNNAQMMLCASRISSGVTYLRRDGFLVRRTFRESSGFFIPFTYIPPLAVDLDISLQDAAFLISIIGITNTIGRVAVGFISDQPWADCILINNVALIVAGVATMLVPLFTSYPLLAAYVAVFGLGIAVFVSLRSIIMVELMGLERLTSAFGLVIMFQGVSSYIGAPIAGSIADVFGSYDAAFYLSGATLALSGVICLPLRKVAAWEKRREEKRSTPEAKAMLKDDKK